MISTVYIAKNVYGGDGLGRLGDGCLGDWGAHTMDTMHRFFELGLPTDETSVL